MRRLLAAISMGAVALSVVAPSAHAANECGNANSITGAFTHSKAGLIYATIPDAEPIPGVKTKGRNIIPVDLGPAGKYYVDDRNYTELTNQAVAIPFSMVDHAKVGDVGWSVGGEDHAAGFWLYEESGKAGGLQPGGPQVFFDQLPPDVENAFYENVGSSDDPCKHPNAALRDLVIF